MECCGNCLFLETDNRERYSSEERYWCKDRWKYVSPNDRTCINYNPNVSNRNNYNSSNGGYQQSGCEITTIVRDILGYDDNCELLKLFRNFRDTILKKNESYIPLLLEYDQLSPTISEKIREDENRNHFCLDLMQRFLLPLGNEVKQNNINGAVATYTNFMSFLKISFGLLDTSVDMKTDYDLETLGKGRIRLKPNTSTC